MPNAGVETPFLSSGVLSRFSPAAVHPCNNHFRMRSPSPFRICCRNHSLQLPISSFLLACPCNSAYAPLHLRLWWDKGGLIWTWRAFSLYKRKGIIIFFKPSSVERRIYRILYEWKTHVTADILRVNINVLHLGFFSYNFQVVILCAISYGI